ncbi:TPA: hypothetical protein QEM49_001357 [Pseudomonas putida]|uniref:hypothetical protein n=1 Tax=Pseudomonas putida TaxID=303 RepID=UPI00236489CF|nr:hypothetical protein [Pseudomonas putida]MDD2010289.1 hypothetical protein [Pseudomonas putida]HDS1776875.1 hypothetical protein [Pseudomonas putida]
MSNTPEILFPDHPAYTDAVEAMRRWHEAKDAGAPALEVERLRQIAESMFQAVTDYQLRAFGLGGGYVH